MADVVFAIAVTSSRTTERARARARITHHRRSAATGRNGPSGTTTARANISGRAQPGVHSGATPVHKFRTCRLWFMPAGLNNLTHWQHITVVYTARVQVCLSPRVAFARAHRVRVLGYEAPTELCTRRRCVNPPLSRFLSAREYLSPSSRRRYLRDRANIVVVARS